MQAMLIIIVYFVCLLDLCDSESVTENAIENMTKYAHGTTHASLLELATVLNKTPQFNNSDIRDVNISHMTVNDIMQRFNITTESNQTAADSNKLTHNYILTTMVVTQTSSTNAMKPIYIRGHLLYHPSPDQRRSELSERSHKEIRAPNAVHLSNAEDLLKDLDGASSRKKRKHSSSRDRVHEYMSSANSKGADLRKKKTEFYAWIFGASMLGLGSLTTVTSCFVFCFCSDKVRQKRQTQIRQSADNAGEYQRVASVSYTIDHVGVHCEHCDNPEHSELYYDLDYSAMEGVTSI